LLTVSNDLARSFYEKQTIHENWTFREMKRQIDSSLRIIEIKTGAYR